MGHLRTENTQVIPPPAFYCIDHNQTYPLQSRERDNVQRECVRVRVRVRVRVKGEGKELGQGVG